MNYCSNMFHTMSSQVKISRGVVLLLLGGSFAFADVAPTTLPSHPSFGQRYSKVLTDDNIFIRDRGYHPPPPRPHVREVVQMSPEQTYVLTGIVLENGGYRAYFEDLAQATGLRVNVGDKLAQGTIGEIRIDAVAYDHGSSRTWVTIGTNLGGGAVENVSDARVAAAANSQPPTTQPGDVVGQAANEANLSVEERMKLRRLQERAH